MNANHRAEDVMLAEDMRPLTKTYALPSPDGLALFVRDYAPVGPETGVPVVCLHGLTRNSRDFELLAPRIAALGRRALAPDMRGRGQSARDPDPAHYSPLVYTQDVLAILDKLEIARAVFVGTSMGGIVTMAIASAAPERVAAAVLNDIGPVLEPAGYLRIGAYVGKNMDFANEAEAFAALKAAQGANYPGRDEDFWRAFLRRTCRLLPDGRVGLDYDPAIGKAFEGATAPPDLTQLFDAMAATPLLVVHGAESDLLSAEGIELMRIIQPDLQTVDVPGVGHAPTLEEEPAWLAILDFLAKAD